MSEGTTLGKAWVQIVPSAEGISGSISRILDGEAASAGVSAGSAIGGSMADAIKGAIAAAGIGTAIKSSIDAGMNFDSEMAHVSAISGVAGEAFDTLRDKALELGSSTKFSASESAEAFGYMAMAGWNAEQMLNGVDGILSLAAADGLDLASTADIVTDALTAFGLSASDSGHFADVLAVASSSANTNVAMIGETFKYVAPLAGSLKLTAEDVAQAVGLMANAGIKASQAGTALRSGLSRLVSPTSDMIPLMKKLGLAVSELSEEEAKAKVDALEASVAAREKAYGDEEEKLRESLDKRRDALQKSLEQQYDAKEKAWDKEIGALQEAQEKELDATQKAQEAAVREYEKATEAKLALIDREYQESLKNTDKAEYDRLKALDDQIAAIEAESEAASRAAEEQERARRRAELQKAVDSAKSAEARMEAERKLADYNENIRRKDEEAARKARVADLKAQKDAVKEQAKAERDAAKDKRDAEAKAYKEERAEGLEALKDRHKDELAELKRAQKETLEEKKDARKTELDELKKANDAALAETKKGNDRQLKALQASNKEKLSAYQDYVKEQKKAFESAAKSARSLVLTDESGNMRTLNESVELLREAFSGLSSAEQAEAASALFGQEAMSGWLAMLNASGESVASLSNAVNHADGAAERMAAITQNSLKGAVTSFNSAVEGLQIAAYDKFSDKMTDMVSLARDGVSMITGVIATGDLTPLKEFGSGLIQSVLTGVREKGPELLQHAFQIASGFAGSLYRAFREALGNFGLLEGFDSVIAGIAAGDLTPLKEFGSNLIQNVLAGVREKGPELLQHAFQIASGFAGNLYRAFRVVLDNFGLLDGFDNALGGVSAIFEGVSGTAARVFPEVRDAVVNAFERIREAVAPASELISGLASKFGEYVSGGQAAEGAANALSAAVEILGGVIEFAVNVIATAVEKMADFITWLAEGGASADLFAAAVGGVVAAFVAFKTAMAITAVIDGVSKAITGAKAAFAALHAVMAANPFVLVATLVAGAAAALITLWNTNEDFRNAVIDIWGNIKDGIAAAWEGIKTAASAAWEFIKGVFSAVGGFFKGVWEAIATALTPPLDAVKAAFSLAWTIIKGVWSVASAFFGVVWEGIKAVFSVAAPVLRGFFSLAWAAVKGVWSVAAAFFGGVWEGVKIVFSVAKAVIGGFFSTAWAAVKLVWNAATGYFKNIWNSVAGIFSAVESVLRGDFSGAWKAIQGVFKGWGGFFQGLWRDLTNVFAHAFDWFADVGKNIVKGLKTGVGGLWNGFLSFLGLKTDEVKQEFTGPEGFDEHSPSKWSEDVFRRVLEGGKIGFGKGLPSILSSAESAAQGIRDMLAIDPLRVGVGYDYAQSVRRSVTQSADAVTDAAPVAVQSGSERVKQPIQVILNQRVLGEYMIEYIQARGRAMG